MTRATLRYLWYVIRHKWFVLVAGLKIGAPLHLLFLHDWSKFSPSEWRAYRDYFYRKDSQEALRAMSDFGCAECAPYGYFQKDRFNVAWLHHQRRNKHHWQYWLLREDDGDTFPLPMPEKYIREMVADWMGAGRAITCRWEVAEWYEKNKGKIVLRSETRARVESLLAFPEARTEGGGENG